ncbi:MAG: nickel pincer cofactor biosynthesis protein LarB [Flavobacteriaceae bacterium]|nr:nickel pincer cofactor biosynthesis protein LarB [Flavobacteriaceae bacterium]
MINQNIDDDREKRIGFPEVVYGESKSIADLLRILAHFVAKDSNVLVTKLQEEKAVKLIKEYPKAFYDAVSGIFMLNVIEELTGENEVAIVSAGTSDIHVVNEVYYTLGYMGVASKRIADVGVAGIHRLLNKVEELKTFKVLIVVAGFEGALPTVMGGLLPQPIIAIPADVGYGVAKGGHVALNAMLSSCANGISVVNINNGYGAAMSAVRILNLISKK